jgi:hypothetical protein
MRVRRQYHPIFRDVCQAYPPDCCEVSLTVCKFDHLDEGSLVLKCVSESRLIFQSLIFTKLMSL